MTFTCSLLPARLDQSGSPMEHIIRIHVSRAGEEELFRFLAQRNVIFVLARMSDAAAGPVNPVRTIEVIRGLSTNASVGGAIAAWMNAGASRNAVIYTKQRNPIHLRGLDTTELERHLEDADQISLVDPDANHPVKKVAPLVGG